MTKRIVIVMVILVPVGYVVVLIGAPYRKIHKTCLYCGYNHVTYSRLGRVTQWEESTQASDWIYTLYPEHREHTYVDHMFFVRSKWFGSEMHGYGGPVAALYRMMALYGMGFEEEAKNWLAEWHKAIELPTKERRERFRDIYDAVQQQHTTARENLHQLEIEQQRIRDEEDWRKHKLQEKRLIQEELRKRRSLNSNTDHE